LGDKLDDEFFSPLGSDLTPLGALDTPIHRKLQGCPQNLPPTLATTWSALLVSSLVVYLRIVIAWALLLTCLATESW